MEGVEAGQQVVLAPVGTAFARCLKEFPEINIYGSDKYHASVEGSYLAALVILLSDHSREGRQCRDLGTVANSQFLEHTTRL